MTKICLNGEDREIANGTTVGSLLETLEADGLAVDRRAVAIEVNRAIVPRSTYSTYSLADRDEVEIVTIVGGG